MCSDKISSFKYSGGYGAHVVQNEEYILADLKDIGESVHFELHDLYPENGDRTAFINLRICLGK